MAGIENNQKGTEGPSSNSSRDALDIQTRLRALSLSSQNGGNPGNPFMVRNSSESSPSSSYGSSEDLALSESFKSPSYSVSPQLDNGTKPSSPRQVITPNTPTAALLSRQGALPPEIQARIMTFQQSRMARQSRTPSANSDYTNNNVNAFKNDKDGASFQGYGSMDDFKGYYSTPNSIPSSPLLYGGAQKDGKSATPPLQISRRSSASSDDQTPFNLYQNHNESIPEDLGATTPTTGLADAPVITEGSLASGNGASISRNNSTASTASTASTSSSGRPVSGSFSGALYGKPNAKGLLTKKPSLSQRRGMKLPTDTSLPGNIGPNGVPITLSDIGERASAPGALGTIDLKGSPKTASISPIEATNNSVLATSTAAKLRLPMLPGRTKKSGNTLAPETSPAKNGTDTLGRGGITKPDPTKSTIAQLKGNLPPVQQNVFTNYAKYLDIRTGSLNFAGKASVHANGIDFMSGTSFRISIEELEPLGELGAGNYGTVTKVLHKPTGIIMAMKEIRLELDEQKFTQIIMELEVLHKCVSPYIVDFYGAFFVEGAVYICMEYMDGGSLNKIYEGGIDEPYLAVITDSAIRGLMQLKEEHNIIHRDVKPTNILISTAGTVKLCDFGVSGNLVASIARTNIGCQSYMAPERIRSKNPNEAITYTVESDIWSLGLSILETAQGSYPYPPETYENIFSQLSAIVDGEPPTLPKDKFSAEAQAFVSKCLNKVPRLRPSYAQLLNDPWLVKYRKQDVDIGDYVKSIKDKQGTTE